ncbi:DUF5134 domain-containing protein [Streptomyces litchfieldiae]|uniref:DUF5134 domain-containing protein n=1 Tax=Streptomyces litchfieldiae TaxID=3075543 RepID=A0ABU2N1J1_9ACTN|nr:DUF5134 domain-containing protein [Streptomyces sp. DSM 44938]MDT0347174.1 DUF5134 domain-containing protein [Streptomyces sp. DSM 44938]
MRHGPELVGWLVAALCGTAGAYCLWRARAPAARGRQAAAVEAVMGLGTALMAVPATAVPAPPPAAFAVLFSATALWSAALLAAGAAHQAHHVVEGLAMVYMAVAMAGGAPAHAEHPPGGVPLLTGALLAYFAGYALRSGPRLLPAAPGGAGAGPAGHAEPLPEVAVACRLALALGMFAMLLML